MSDVMLAGRLAIVQTLSSPEICCVDSPDGNTGLWMTGFGSTASVEMSASIISMSYPASQTLLTRFEAYFPDVQPSSTIFEPRR